MNLEQFEPPPQGGAADAQLPGHQADLSLAGVGAAQDGLALQLRQREQRLPHHLIRHQLMAVTNGGGQRLRRDLPLTCVEQGMLDRAAQLPQIAGPG